MNETREKMNYDVVIVGAGPSGLSAGIKIKNLALKNNKNISVCILEKGAEVGSHIISGAVIETRALDELIPDWKINPPPGFTKVIKEEFLYFKEKTCFSIPNILLPKTIKNENNYIISLANLCRWLSKKAEDLGVEIYPGFPAKEIIYDDSDAVIGVRTLDMGISKNGEKSDAFEPGIDIMAKYTLLAEGCRGSLGKLIINKYKLAKEKTPQTYGIGLKEIWEIDSPNHKEGHISHSVGWPLSNKTYGGSFLYHMPNKQISIGLVVGLDYKNPYLSPYEEFQKFKTHPQIKNIIKNGRRVAYGARAINEGGYYSLPKLYFPGGALIGCDAGTLNVAKIKGTHTAMKSGIIAAENIYKNLSESAENNKILLEYEKDFYKSWAGKELKKAKNFRAGFKYGLFIGLFIGFIELSILRGRSLWQLKLNHTDNESTEKAKYSNKIHYEKADGIYTFDKLTNLSFSGTNHVEDQPNHLQILDDKIPIKINLEHYGSPETNYCPANVYEIIKDNGIARLQINSQNCLHCKTCDIKDPKQNINWVTPQGGDGPNYPNM